ncbi:capsular polysaccharide export protein [Rhizobium cellulosilyticum]|uniref:Capsular polysaccharide export protein n=2 Tax=Aliirhizobium cellulosilyticum TaxID=393664 RepID=A0A7W6V3W3_9HYPH|nr:capsular polysaccharide export protein [Rhizobium cellulosilyticum]MBB4411967.1 capsular polysaccharide export protein [Rhizobium cellulosilyticum]MBB4449433.1 capsular polysaccharide export protein [Rhizobium cellulosilyticum]
MSGNFHMRLASFLSRAMPQLEPRSYVLGLNTWKHFIKHWLAGEKVVRRNRHIGKLRFYLLIAPFMLMRKGSKVYVWGYKIPPFIEDFCLRHAIPITRVEDGFLRSIALGATRAPPISLCFDSSAMYFDATKQSDLERIIETYDFEANPRLIERAKAGMGALIASRLSKYNASNDVDIDATYGPKTRKRILVVGQVEGDASIEKGCDRKIDNNDLVKIAAYENPGAQIIYKPHPELLHGTRPYQSNPRDVSHLAMILEQDITLADAFNTVDHVYTITSLSGFEALIRDIPVTCVGMPFYAGWGATDDRQKCDRRTARRTPLEIFAAAYILYPRYFDPERREELNFEGALALLASMRRRKEASTSREPSVR